MTTRTLQINRIQFVKIISIAIVGAVFCYVYMINAISFNTAARERISDLISIRQSEISDLESQFLANSRKINREIARNLGLVKSVENEAIVVVRDSNTRLTFNE